MNLPTHPEADPKLDLVLERFVDLPPETIWKAWTTPELLVQWFCPRPWTTKSCKIDLYPGGEFSTIMVSPEGVEHPNEGCILKVEENRRLVWTDGLLAGYRPKAECFVTAILILEPEGTGTKYTAIAKHKDEATQNQHREMGFHTGWSAALDQLIALME